MNILTERDRNRLVEYRNELSRFAPEVIVDLILSSGDQARERSRFGCSLNALYLSSGIVLPKFMVERLIRWLPMWFLVVAQSPIKFLHEARKLLRVVFMNGSSGEVLPSFTRVSGHRTVPSRVYSRLAGPSAPLY